MSIEDGPELRDLIAQTLENNGVLAKIRAELRASVFLALEEQETFQNKLPFRNGSLKTFLKTSEGSLITSLVREFLEFFELDFTLSVFDSETFHGTEYSYEGREKLMKKLELKNINELDGPLLSSMLHSALRSNCIVSNHLPEVTKNRDISLPEKNSKQLPKAEKVLLKNDEISSEAGQGDSVFSEYKNERNAISRKNDSPAIRDIDNKKSADILHIDSSLQVQSTEDNKKGMKEPKTGLLNVDLRCKQGSSLSSLNNLPPLMGAIGSTLKSTDSHLLGNLDRRNQTKMVINLGTDVVNNYEEDFQSSASASAQEGQSGKHSIPESDTEIEEDIGSGVEDLLSNVSGMDDLTVDATASGLSVGGDYMENIAS